MSYADGLAFLDRLRRHGMRPGLERMQRLLDVAGHPERGLRFIHVAGTNGKGSTCALMESVARLAGLRTGLFTSPHLIHFRERVQIRGECIPEAAVAEILAKGEALLRGWEEAEWPTFFEMVTWMGLEWFAAQNCDLVIWETGLGGRLDATNVVTPEVAVITPIGWDHIEWLGHTLEAIASEKAGIIKEGVPVFTSADEPSAVEVIRATARERNARFEWIAPGHEWVERVRGWDLALFGEHQVRNAALAAAALGVVESRWPRVAEVMREGMETARWPGRFEVRKRDSVTWVIDGAHNRPAFESLAAALVQRFGQRPFELVLGMLADKELESVVPGLVDRAVRVQVVPVASARGCPPEQLAAVLRGRCPGVRLELAGAVSEAAARVGAGSLVVVTGSLYLVGEVLEWMDAPKIISERGLNDWGRTR